MLLYTHAVWSLDLTGFIGHEGWVPVDLIRQYSHTPPGANSPDWTYWSVFYWIDSTWLLWTVHIIALIVFACLTLGLFTRVVAVLAYLLAVSYAHRVTPGAFFGLDKVKLHAGYVPDARPVRSKVLA